MKNGLTRHYIYEENYDEVIAWAKKQYKVHGVRSKNNRALQYNFPEALEKYIQWLKNGKQD